MKLSTWAQVTGEAGQKNRIGSYINGCLIPSHHPYSSFEARINTNWYKTQEQCKRKLIKKNEQEDRKLPHYMIKWEYLELILIFFKRAYSKSHSRNIASSRNPYKRQTCKSSWSQNGAQCVYSTGLELLCPRADHKGSASSVTPCQNPVGFPGSSYCCLLTIPADQGDPLQELCYCPAQSTNGPFWALTARSPYW